MNIWVGTHGFATQKNIKDAEITFKVDKAWVSENNIDSIIMMRYDETWQTLPTQKIKGDEAYLYYKASTREFSPFAITGYTSTAILQKIPEIKVKKEDSLKHKPDVILLVIPIIIAIGYIMYRFLNKLPLI